MAQSDAASSSEAPFIQQIRNKNPLTYSVEYNSIEQDLIFSDDQTNLFRLYTTHSDNLFFHAAIDSAIVILHKAKKIIKNEKSLEFVQVCVYLALLHNYIDNFDSLDYWYNRASALSDQHKSIEGNLVVLESIKAFNQSNYSLSINRLLEAIRYFQSTGNEENLAISYQNLAVSYGRLGDIEAQRDYHSKAIDIFKKLNLDYPLIENYNSLGSVMRSMDLLDEALSFYNLAYDKLKLSEYPLLLAQNFTNRANIFEKKGLYNQAEQLFFESLKISEKNGISYGVMLNELNLGNLFRLKKEYSKSEDYLQRGLQSAISLNTRREKALVYERLSWLERDRSNYKLAYEYQKEFYQLNDSLIGESVQKEVAELKKKYELETKENEILSLSKDRVQMQYTITMLTTLLTFLLFLLYWLWARSKLKQKEQQKQEQILKFDLKMKEKELLSESITKIAVSSIKENIAEEISQIINDFPKTQSSKFKNLLTALKNDNSHILIDEFETRFNGVYDTFYDKLKEVAPDISKTELKIASLIRLNLSTKEIADLTLRSTGTIDNARSSIRRKLKLAENENLADRLSEM